MRWIINILAGMLELVFGIIIRLTAGYCMMIALLHIIGKMYM